MTSAAEGMLERICADLSAVKTPDNIVLVHGKPASSITYLALYMVFAGIAREKPVVFLDGANSFDPYLISRIARDAGLVPEELLSRVHISRAFTCHQMEALVRDRLAGAFRTFHTNVAIVSGLLDTFYDEDVSLGEAHGMLRATTDEFVRLARRGARILLACPDTHLPAETRQRRFVGLLKKISDKVLRSESDNGETTFAMEKPLKRHYGVLKTPAIPLQQRWR